MPDPKPSQPRANSRLRKPTSTPRSKTPPAPSPVRSIEPGHVHYRIAGGLLKGIQERAATAGVNLDVGEIPDLDSNGEGAGNDPERLTRLVAHAVARVGDRFTVLRKLNRHLEGSDRRAGLLSDVAAALMELYRRNPEAMESLGKQAGANFVAHREQRKREQAAKQQTQTPTPGGPINHASR